MRALPVVLAMALLSVPVVTQAQMRPEIRPFVGAFIPTGDERHVFDDAAMTGAQVAVEAADMLHWVGTFAFAGPDFDSGIARGGHMNIYQSDVGAELFRSIAMRNDWQFRPFLGAGAGIRTYDPTGDAKAKGYPAGYGAVGAELQMDRVAFRFETRDYLTRFKGLTGTEDATTRNDLALSLGLAYHIW